MPILRPERPRLANAAEREVWQLLANQLFDDEALLSGLRVTDRAKDHEADVVVLSPGAGIVVVEVKGGSVWTKDGCWYQARGDLPPKVIDPVRQARETRYALREYLEADPRWGSRTRVRTAHMVVLPHSFLGEDFALPDCPAWMVVGRNELGALANKLRAALHRQESEYRASNDDDVQTILSILAGRGRDQRDVVADAVERESAARLLTQDQAVILGAARLLNRVEVRGGAGSGKTWLALEQARRLTEDGGRVALLCYSRGLAAYLQREVAALPRRSRPAYVGLFHGIGHAWGAALSVLGDDDSDYWEHWLPAQIVELAADRPEHERFDAIIIDESQDFADNWWPAVLAMLKNDEYGGLYVFTDDGQRVFARFGRPPVPLVPLILDQNLRNTKQIAQTFDSLTPIKMRLAGGDGPAVRFMPCAAGDAMDHGDDAVEHLLDEGWSPGDIALLTTGSRHVEQVQRQQVGQDEYWLSYWDPEQVFYGHVLGFKGLERRAVVLVLNESEVGDRSRERLYVGLSRARDQLVVCGDPEMIRALAGDEVLALLRSDTS